MTVSRKDPANSIIIQQTIRKLIHFNIRTCNFPYMRGEQLTDAIIYDKLNLLKKDFSGYIERNSVKVDENLPVFFGHMISALEKSFPDISV